ncbi:MAG: Crp/Fnr family transcriptional regulator [Clostridia bacterium]|nr:Crp/Fnr family transcriptional regulator [Clostridia bacterium]
MGKTDCIKSLYFFADLDKRELNEVVELAQKKIFKKNEIIFNQGDRADKIFIVKEGNIKLFKISEDGKQLTLEILSGNNVFGENSLFSDECYSMSAQSIDETCVTIYYKDDMEKLLKSNPTISLKVIKTLSKKLYLSNEFVSNIAFNDARGRLINVLKKFAVDYGVHTEQGILIDFYLTHQDLASIINASRTTTTNILLSLREEGLISIKDRKIVVDKALL